MPRPDPKSILDAAATALGDAWDEDVRLYLQGPIRSEWGRHTVLLCNVDGPPGSPTTVVVKAAAEPEVTVFNEWATLEWLRGIEAAAPLVPYLHAGNVTDQLVVMEDVGAGPSLHRLLQGEQSWATEALAAGQRLLATIHSATRGRGTDLAEVRATLPPAAPQPQLDVSRSGLGAELGSWDVALPDAAVDELAWVEETLDVPGSFRCLTFHDACPVNRIMTSAGLRAVDLEMAAFRHPMIDGAYGPIGHLRCSVRRLRPDDGLALPPHVRRIAVDAYRAAVTGGYPEYMDDTRFNRDLAAASAVWMVEILRRMRPKVRNDKPTRFFGVAACQRVRATLDAFRRISVATSELPILAAWAETLADELAVRWPHHPPLPVAGAWR